MSAASGRFVRHTVWNLAAIVVPLAIGLAAIPITARALGAERFGILGIAWALLEYLALLDAGLGRATVFAVARRLAAGEPAPSATITAALIAQFTVGMLGGAALFAAAPLVTTELLRIPEALHAEARGSFALVAFTVPFVVLGLALRGVLDAAERFDLAAAIRLPSSAATFIVPAIAAPLGASLPTILAVLLGARVATCAVTWVVARRALPGLHLARSPDWHALRGLARYGGWVALSAVLSIVLLYFDRLVLGATTGVAAVGAYLGPFELAVRLLVLPGAIVGALFPAASAAASVGRWTELGGLARATRRAVLLIMLPPVLLGIVVAVPLLTALFGATLAGAGALPMRLLLTGVLFTALAHVPSMLLLASNRPRALAGVHVATVVVHVPVTLALVTRFGVSGAAAAWCGRALLDALLLFVVTRRVLEPATTPARGSIAPAVGVAAVVLVAPPALCLWWWPAAPLPALPIAVIVGLVAYAAFLWRFVLEPAERHALMSVRGRGGAFSAAVLPRARPPSSSGH